MSYPYPPPGYYSPPPPRKPFSTADVVWTSILSVALLGIGFVAFVWSLFAMMATDGCGTPNKCSDGTILFAYVVAWGGLGTALLLAVVGISVAASKRKTMYVWPAIGLVILVVAMIAGGFLLNEGVGG